MIRLPALAALILVQLSAAALAQDDIDVPEFGGDVDLPSADSDNQAEIEGTPTVILSMPANPNDLLTGLYATRAVVEVCDITIEPAVAEAMSADEARYAQQLNISAQMAAQTYGQIKSAIESRGTDCSEGSADVSGVNAVVAVYSEVSAP